MDQPFWETTPLKSLTHDQWEQLCDGCGLCCLHRLQGEDDNDPILTTSVVCRGYDLNTCQCSDYANRFTLVPGCTQLAPENVAEFDWLPQTCAYRRVYNKQPLPSWHPLLSNNSALAKEYGILSVNPILETPYLDLEEYILEEE